MTAATDRRPNPALVTCTVTPFGGWCSGRMSHASCLAQHWERLDRMRLHAAKRGTPVRPKSRRRGCCRHAAV